MHLPKYEKDPSTEQKYVIYVELSSSPVLIIPASAGLKANLDSIILNFSSRSLACGVGARSVDPVYSSHSILNTERWDACPTSSPSDLFFTLTMRRLYSIEMNSRNLDVNFLWIDT